MTITTLSSGSAGGGILFGLWNFLLGPDVGFSVGCDGLKVGEFVLTVGLAVGLVDGLRVGLSDGSESIHSTASSTCVDGTPFSLVRS